MKEKLILTALKAGHNEVFKYLAPKGYTFEGDVTLGNCTGITSLDGVTFNGDAYLWSCTGLTSLTGAIFNGGVDLEGCTDAIIAEAKAKGVRVIV